MRREFKNKAERNSGFISLAQQIFSGKKMLLERPPEMSYDEYRLLRKIESETLKRLFHKGKSPDRRLQGITGHKEPLARTKKGVKRIVKQRRAS
jgi:hypothetical protein